MTYTELKKLREKLFFTVADVSETFAITQPSARIACARYAQKGVFLRLKNNFYTLDEKWAYYRREDFLQLAGYLQVPSYVSLTTALAFYEVTTQVARASFENVAFKRSCRLEQKGTQFSYFKIRKDLYFGFSRQNGFFIASKEKALADALYFSAFGKYAFDAAALDKDKIDRKELKKILKKFPRRVMESAKKLCLI